jgi:medium-chain acyl-[acyl-carrier-protein] hydrolase
MKSEWFFCRKPRPAARLRLYCFHHAGGAGSVFFTWPDVLPEWIEVHAVQLPGREKRAREPLCRNVPEVVEGLLDAIGADDVKPFAFYGHSLGGALAYALALELHRLGRSMPSLFLVSARRAPDTPRRWAPFHQLPKQSFLRTLQTIYGNLPGFLYENPGLLDHFFPIMQADMELLNSLEIDDVRAPLFDCPMVVFGGKEDPSVTYEELSGWERHTTSDSFELCMIGGDHLFPINRREAFLGELVERWPDQG